MRTQTFPPDNNYSTERIYQYDSVQEILTTFLNKDGLTWNDVEYSTIEPDQLKTETRSKINGGTSIDWTPIGPFIIWTKDLIYFYIEFEGMSGYDSISRNPLPLPHKYPTTE